MGEFLLDPKRKIPASHLKRVCKKGQGAKCCRYIALSVSGFACMKNTPIKTILDDKVLANEMSAKADNCSGLGDLPQ